LIANSSSRFKSCGNGNGSGLQKRFFRLLCG
jgi:hypothetical protein